MPRFGAVAYLGYIEADSNVPQGKSSPGTPPFSADDRSLLPRDLSIFLVQFSIALSKTKTYPPGHPALAAGVAGVLQRLLVVLHGREGLSIGVARHQLIVEGRATDERHPVLRELALRLHRHQLVRVHLSSGMELGEFTDLLSRLGDETWRQGRPLGLEPRPELERWPHAQLEPLALEQLEIGSVDAPSEDRQGHATELWLGLATAAMRDSRTEPNPGGATGVPSPQEIAGTIKRFRGNPAYDKVIVDYMHGLGELLAEGSGSETATLRQRLTELLNSMDVETLKLLLGGGSDSDRQRSMLLRATKSLPVNAVLKLLEATAATTQQGVSHAFLRILQKLATNFEVGDPVPGYGAEAALRGAVHQLVTGLSSEDPNPASHRRLLELLARWRPEADASEPMDAGHAGSEAIHIVQMSLEVGTTGDAVWGAADELIQRGELTLLLDTLDSCGTEPAAEAIWNWMGSGSVVRRLLSDGAVEAGARERLLDHLGQGAAEAMLDQLEVTENLPLRRRLLSRLGEFGESVGPLIPPRLPGKPWYVQRNLLLLLGSMSSWPAGFSPASYTGHPDVRVRREAYKLLLQRAESRSDAVTDAVAADDVGIVRLGLVAALEDCPPAALRPLLAGLNGRYRDPEILVLGVKVLALQSTTQARNWMLRRALAKPRWFRRRHLESKSPVMLAALGGLAARWAKHSEVAAVLRLAAASSDPDIRAAAHLPTR